MWLWSLSQARGERVEGKPEEENLGEANKKQARIAGLKREEVVRQVDKRIKDRKGKGPAARLDSSRFPNPLSAGVDHKSGSHGCVDSDLSFALGLLHLCASEQNWNAPSVRSAAEARLAITRTRCGIHGTSGRGEELCCAKILGGEGGEVVLREGKVVAEGGCSRSQKYVEERAMQWGVVAESLTKSQ